MFIEQPARGAYDGWLELYKMVRLPKIFNLRTDPFETADFTSNTYYNFMNRYTWMMPASMGLVGQLIGTLKEFPRRRDPPAFDPGAAMRQLEEASSSQ